MGSSKARSTTSCKIGPCIGPAALWEEVMMQRDSFGKRFKEGVRQLEVNNLVWIMDENVKKHTTRWEECWKSTMEAMGE